MVIDPQPLSPKAMNVRILTMTALVSSNVRFLNFVLQNG